MGLKRKVTKPDLGDGVSHPARFPLSLFPLILQSQVPPPLYPRVLDPFAGTGRVHLLRNVTIGVELEYGWARMSRNTITGNALALPFPDNSFDAVVTSPTFGNRLADSHNAQDGSLRRSYTHDLGHPLHPDNSGGLQWGSKYRDFHLLAWAEITRVCGRRLVLDIKDHYRHKVRQYVTDWHVQVLEGLGWVLVKSVEVPTRHLRQGANYSQRLPEMVLTFDMGG